MRDIMLAAYAEYRGVLPVDSGAHAETLDDVMADMRRGGAALAYDGVAPVGSARFRSDADLLYVGRLAVLPSHRRRGVASAIMRFLERVAADGGHAGLTVGVRESLPSNVELYRGLGFGVTAIDPHPGGADRVLTMVKRLD